MSQQENKQQSAKTGSVVIVKTTTQSKTNKQTNKQTNKSKI